MSDNQLIALINRCQESDFYPHPVQEPITVIQTHISVVFLTGEYAYKIKKPVNFGFLDFSTLEKRHHFLNEELRMNQPLAPELYLEILPITERDGKLILGGTGEPVEYVLKMRQFAQDNLLENMFEQGKLTESHIENIGKIVAKFHKQSLTNEKIRGFGEVEVIRESIDDNYRQTQKYIGLAQTQQQYDETKQFTDNFLAENIEIFKQRQKGDKIRECHGDLHLKNICLWEDQIYLFDRIEFNEPFRFVDVIYDVAFAVMDLDARGRKDFANIFLNTYLEQTGDWSGLQVLPLYLSRQAYVRAKVTSFLLDDPNISEATKQEARQTAAKYYHQAWEYTKKAPGKIILMSGLSGSGKTTVAQQLAKENNAIHIRSDAVRKHLAGIPLNQRGGNELYTPEMTEKTYTRLLDLGLMLAYQGYTVILDAKYDRQLWREKVITAAQNHDIPVEIIYCDAPREVLRDRLLQRSEDISDATTEVLKQQTFEPFTETEKTYVKVVDSSK